MVDAFKKMIDNWKDFEGRTSRPDYWWATLGTFIFECIVTIIISIVVAVAFGEDSVILGILGILMIIAVGVVGIFIAIAGLSMSIRRIRDAGFPWWFWFANFLPSIGNIVFIVLLCLPTSDEPVINLGGNSAPASQPAPAPQPEPAPAPKAPEAPIVDVTPEEAPVVNTWNCPNCGAENEGNFCASCGAARP